MMLGTDCSLYKFNPWIMEINIILSDTKEYFEQNERNLLSTSLKT